jgi:hypothetical protein
MKKDFSLFFCSSFSLHVGTLTLHQQFLITILIFSKMKTSSIKIAAAALLMAVGTLGIQAQNGRGTGISGTGTCISTATLTDEQQVIVDELKASFEAEMTALRADLLATTVITEKIAIHNEMMALRDAFQAELKDLLASWGITVNPGGGKGTLGKGGKKGSGTGVCTGTGSGTASGTGNKYGNSK